ncbi:MAG: HAD hydrolase family protein [Deltaproteobacteria bacterium]|nr:HAD hydrolase family protein [Deltaproteobacteria bacterium]
MTTPPDIREIDAKARRVRALILDVDGVLTDGRVIYLPGGNEGRTFHVRDGLGIQLLMASGCTVALLSGRESDVVTRRAHELGITALRLGIEDKVDAFESLLDEFQLNDLQVAYVGDDLPDIPVLRRAGLGFAVADAAPEVRSAADLVLRTAGGQGAVREACERILKAKEAWRV